MRRPGDDIQRTDITGQETLLPKIGINPTKALMEIYVKNEKQEILSEIEAYVFLRSKVPVLKPSAKIIGLPLVRTVLSRAHHCMVKRWLRRSGRQ